MVSNCFCNYLVTYIICGMQGESPKPRKSENMKIKGKTAHSNHTRPIFATAPKSLQKVCDGRKRQSWSFCAHSPKTPRTPRRSLHMAVTGCREKRKPSFAGHQPRCPPSVAWLHRTRFDWLNGLTQPRHRIDTSQHSDTARHGFFYC
jgi:hypothetical protein